MNGYMLKGKDQMENNVETREPKALPILLKEYCGAPGENFSDFRKQYQSLTQADLDWFRAEFIKMGVPIK